MTIKATRKEWVANPADPTQVVRWILIVGPLHTTLIASWGVEMTIRLGRWTHRAYDSWLAKQLFNRLESRWENQQREYDDEPSLRYYE